MKEKEKGDERGKEMREKRRLPSENRGIEYTGLRA